MHYKKQGKWPFRNMREDLYSHILKLPRTFYDHRPVGVLLTRLTTDMEALGESMAMGVLSIITDFIKTIAPFYLPSLPQLGIDLGHSAHSTSHLLDCHLLRGKLRYYYNLTREILATSTGFLQECLNGVKTVQLYAAEEKVIRRYTSKNDEYLRAQTRTNYYDSSLYAIIEGITSISPGFADLVWRATDPCRHDNRGSIDWLHQYLTPYFYSDPRIHPANIDPSNAHYPHWRISICF